MITIYKDYREHAVTMPNAITMPLQSGDYSIRSGNMLLALIERKTIPDMLASMRDGRKDNVDKLINARAVSPGCKLYYIIETNNIASIPTNIIAHLDHLALRDDIHTIYSINTAHTADRITQLANSISTLKISDNVMFDDRSSICSLNSSLVDMTPYTQTIVKNIQGDASNANTTQDNIYVKKDSVFVIDDSLIESLGAENCKQKKTIAIDKKLLMLLPKVGDSTSNKFLNAGIRIADIINNTQKYVICPVNVRGRTKQQLTTDTHTLYGAIIKEIPSIGDKSYMQIMSSYDTMAELLDALNDDLVTCIKPNAVEMLKKYLLA